MNSNQNGGGGARAAPPIFLRSMHKATFIPYISKAKSVIYSESPAGPPPRMQQYGGGHHNQNQNQNQRPIQVLKWSPYGDFIAAGDDRVLRVWNSERPNMKASTELREGRIPAFGSNSSSARAPVSVAWCPTKHSELASVDADGTLRVWDFVSAKMVADLDLGPGEEALSVVWKKDGEELVVCTKKGSIKRISRQNMNVIQSTEVKDPTSNLEFSATSEELLVGSKDGKVHVYDFPTLDEIHTIPAMATSVLSLTLSPYSRYLGVGGTDAILGLWDTQDWTCVRSFGETTSPIRSISFSFDDTLVVGGSDEGGIHINHAEMGDHLYHLETGTGNPHLQWHPRYYALAYSGSNTSGFKVLGNLSNF